MNPQNHTHRSTSQRRQPTLPIGGALIDHHGREIPITEGMIRTACQSLEQSCVGARRRA